LNSVSANFAKLKSVIAVVMFILLTFVLASVGVVQNLIFNRRKFDNWIIMNWGRWTCWLFKIKVQITGLNHLKQGEGGIILFNHSSFVDIFVMAAHLKNIRFGAKIELFKIPIFGLAIKRFGTLPIARNNREEVFKVYEEARVRFSRGEKFSLSPEGGRFYGEQLARFKSGPFVFAINSQVPLIPVVIRGAYQCWPKGSWLANAERLDRVVEIAILEPISTVGLNINQRGQLQNQCYELMNRVYQAH